MVQDRSPDFNDTWDFLQTRISDIKDLNKIYDEVGHVCNNKHSSTHNNNYHMYIPVYI